MQPRPEAALADDHAEELPLLARLDLAFLPRDEQEGVGLEQAAELQAVLGRLGAEDRAQFQFSGRRRELLPLHQVDALGLGKLQRQQIAETCLSEFGQGQYCPASQGTIVGVKDRRPKQKLTEDGKKDVASRPALPPRRAETSTETWRAEIWKHKREERKMVEKKID